MPGIALGAIRGDLTVPGAGDWVSVGRQDFIHDITLIILWIINNYLLLNQSLNPINFEILKYNKRNCIH